MAPKTRSSPTMRATRSHNPFWRRTIAPPARVREDVSAAPPGQLVWTTKSRTAPARSSRSARRAAAAEDRAGRWPPCAHRPHHEAALGDRADDVGVGGEHLRLEPTGQRLAEERGRRYLPGLRTHDEDALPGIGPGFGEVFHRLLYLTSSSVRPSRQHHPVAAGVPPSSAPVSAAEGAGRVRLTWGNVATPMLAVTAMAAPSCSIGAAMRLRSAPRGRPPAAARCRGRSRRTPRHRTARESSAGSRVKSGDRVSAVTGELAEAVVDLEIVDPSSRTSVLDDGARTPARW